MNILVEPISTLASDIVSWVSLAQDAGSIGILIVGVYLFLTGKIISGKVAKQQTDTAVIAVKASVSKEFQDSLKQAVREGFIDGWYEIHKSHEEAVADALARKAADEPKTAPRKR